MRPTSCLMNLQTRERIRMERGMKSCRESTCLTQQCRALCIQADEVFIFNQTWWGGGLVTWRHRQGLSKTADRVPYIMTHQTMNNVLSVFTAPLIMQCVSVLWWCEDPLELADFCLCVCVCWDQTDAAEGHGWARILTICFELAK